MELRSSPTSPYVRKVLVTALELGIQDKMALVNASPYTEDHDLRDLNPLSKVPCLIPDEGPALFDSPVICEHIASLVPGATIFPAPGEARWQALRQQAMGDGILDASLLRRYELNRPEAHRSSDWDDRQKLAVNSTLDMLEPECASWNQDVTIGRITVGCALGYLDFRFDHEPWREGRPALEAWYQFFAERDSMKRTTPIE